MVNFENTNIDDEIKIYSADAKIDAKVVRKEKICWNKTLKD